MSPHRQDRKSGILYDLSEFMKSPLRSGIQRVAYEIFSRWPGRIPLVPVKIDDLGQPRLLPHDTLELMTDFFCAGPGDDRSCREQIIKAGDHCGPPLTPEQIFYYCCMFNPELFYATPRIKFYQWMLSHRRIPIFFVVYDFLPWFYPDAFPTGAISGAMPYLKLIREIQNLSFISEATRRDFLQRVVRKDRLTGPVLRLGCDGLGIESPHFSPEKNNFTMLGTLEPRKNHMCVVDAFQTLWQKGVQADLTFVGRLGWLEHEDHERIIQLEKDQSRFKWLTQLKDDQVSEVVRTSRATIYPSTVEGFGLPPLESLALGVPVIVTESIPSIEMIEPLGQVRLSVPDPESIYHAVMEMLDNNFAREKSEEIRRLNLPTWSDLGREAAAWIEQVLS